MLQEGSRLDWLYATEIRIATIISITCFILFKKNGEPMYIEGKGRFLTVDKQKSLLVKNQYPNLDLRFVFSNSKTRIQLF